MTTKKPWLGGLVPNQLIWDKQYQQAWESQFASAEKVYLLVPVCFKQEAMSIVDKLAEPCEFYSESLVGDTLCFFERDIVLDGGSISTLLCKAYIPHVTAYVNKKYPASLDTNALNLSWFLWNEKTDCLDPVHSTKAVSTSAIVRVMSDPIPNSIWRSQIAYCKKAKTLRLLKGNSDGLPKTAVQSPNWTPGKR